MKIQLSMNIVYLTCIILAELMNSIVLANECDIILTNERFVDFRGQGIRRLLRNPSSSIQSHMEQKCCKGFKQFQPKQERVLNKCYTEHTITSADFSYNYIAQIGRNPLSGWKMLVKLRLDYNGMTTISENAFNAFDLELLSLKGNMLRFVNFKIQDGQRHPIKIDLSDNFLLDIQIRCNKTVETLDYSGNLLKRTNLSILFSVENLYLMSNKIKDLSSAKDYEVGWIDSLYLDQNLITQLKANVTAFKIIKLSLSQNLISTIYHEVFQDDKSLQFVNLSRNLLVEIQEGIFSNLHNLQILDISWNKLLKIDINAFSRMLGLEIFINTGNPTAHVPLGFLTASTNMKRLEIVGTVESLDFFIAFKSLRHLKWCEATMFSFQKIATMISGLTKLELESIAMPGAVDDLNNLVIGSLELLRLNKMNLTAIPEVMMKTGTRLKELSLAFNLIDVVELTSLPLTIQILNLSNNKIDYLYAPTEYINNSLSILDLQNNRFRQVPYILLQSRNILNFINLKDNPLDEISAMVQSNLIKTEYLCFDDKCVNVEVFAYISENLKKQSFDQNPLRCQCNENIRHLEGYTTRELFCNGNSVDIWLFQQCVVGCIQHIVVHNLIDSDEIDMLVRLTTKLLSLSLYNGNLPSLELLTLRCSQQLTKLTIVNCSVNEICMGSFLPVPHLQHLDLSQNNISTFWFNMLKNCPKLELVNLSRNSLENIYLSQDMDLLNFDQLKNLDLSHNFIKQVDLAQISILVNLEALNLTHNKIYTVNTVCDHLYTAICQQFKLKILLLVHNNLTEFSLVGVTALKNLVELDLSENKIRSQHISRLEHLCHLNLKSNYISNVEAKGCLHGKMKVYLTNNYVTHLSHVQLTHSSYLLNVSWNYISEIVGTDLEEKRGLEELYLSHNRISVISEMSFEYMTSLRILDLSYNVLINFESEKIFGSINWQFFNKLSVINLLNNDGLYVISLILRGSITQSVSISTICKVQANQCVMDDLEIEGFIKSPKHMKPNFTRFKSMQNIEVDTFFCTVELKPILKLTCA